MLGLKLRPHQVETPPRTGICDLLLATQVVGLPLGFRAKGEHDEALEAPGALEALEVLSNDWRRTLAALARCTDFGSGASMPFIPDPCTALPTVLLTADAADDTVAAACKHMVLPSTQRRWQASAQHEQTCPQDASQTGRGQRAPAAGGLLAQVPWQAPPSSQPAAIAAHLLSGCRHLDALH